MILFSSLPARVISFTMFDRAWFAKFMLIFGYLMVVVYIGMGILLFLPQVFPWVPGNVKFAFAVFFIAYGLFRLVRIVSGKRKSNEDEEEE